MTDDCFKVVHYRDGIESVYLVTAQTSRQARDEVKWHVSLGHTCDKDCAWTASPFRPEPAYFLYAINKNTGDMTPANSAGGQSMCVTCLGNV